MQRFGPVLVILILLSAIPNFAQSAVSSAPPTTITGAIQTFSGNILDVKPSSTPAVWVTIPADLKVDRDALKPDAKGIRRGILGGCLLRSHQSDGSEIATHFCAGGGCPGCPGFVIRGELVNSCTCMMAMSHVPSLCFVIIRL